MKVLYIILIALAVIILVFITISFFIQYSKSIENQEDSNTNITDNACIILGCEQEDIYVGSINSDKYYSCSCHYAKQINPENVICFSSDNEAVNNGYIKIEC